VGEPVDVDPVAVARTTAGDPPATLTRAERHAAITALTAAGASAARTATLTGLTPRTVQRHRTRTREKPPMPAPDATTLTILKHLLTGRATQFIAAATGTTPATVEHIATTHGWPDRDTLTRHLDAYENRPNVYPAGNTRPAPRPQPPAPPDGHPPRPPRPAPPDPPPDPPAAAQGGAQALLDEARTRPDPPIRKAADRAHKALHTLEQALTRARARDEAAAEEAETRARIAHLQHQISEEQKTLPTRRRTTPSSAPGPGRARRTTTPHTPTP
jgi:hypothetical protein